MSKGRRVVGGRVDDNVTVLRRGIPGKSPLFFTMPRRVKERKEIGKQESIGGMPITVRWSGKGTNTKVKAGNNIAKGKGTRGAAAFSKPQP